MTPTLDEMQPVAAALAVAVDDFDADAVAAVLRPLTVEDLYGLAVFLAAHIHVDQPLEVSIGEERIRRVALKGASDAFGVSTDLILSRSRNRPVFLARAVAMTIAHRAGLSLVAVGRLFDRDHATVANAITVVNRDAMLSAHADRISDRLMLAVAS